MGKRRKALGDQRPPRPRVSLRRLDVSADAWELVPPPCASERADDLAEVRAMIEAGEYDIAMDELRWLLEGCGDLIEAHQLLGEIAVEQGDLPLARGHFGYAVRIVQKALPEGFRGTLPAARGANRAFYESAAGLIDCLRQLGKPKMAADVAALIQRLDPSDPLGLQRGSAGCPSPDEPDVYELKP